MGINQTEEEPPSTLDGARSPAQRDNTLTVRGPKQCCRPTWECWEMFYGPNRVKSPGWNERKTYKGQKFWCCHARYMQSCPFPQKGHMRTWHQPPACSNPEHQMEFNYDIISTMDGIPEAYSQPTALAEAAA